MSKEDQITRPQITESTERCLLSHPLNVPYYTFIAVNIFESSYSYTNVSRHSAKSPKIVYTTTDSQPNYRLQKSNKILPDSRLQAGTVPPQHRLSVTGIAGLLPNHSTLPRTLVGCLRLSIARSVEVFVRHRLPSRTRRHAPLTAGHLRLYFTAFQGNLDFCSALSPTRNWAMLTSAQAPTSH